MSFCLTTELNYYYVKPKMNQSDQTNLRLELQVKHCGN